MRMTLTYRGENFGTFAFMEYRRPRCSLCKVLVKADAIICPHCGAVFGRDS